VLKFILIAPVLSDYAVVVVAADVEPVLNVVVPHDPLPNDAHDPEASSIISPRMQSPFDRRDSKKRPKGAGGSFQSGHPIVDQRPEIVLADRRPVHARLRRPTPKLSGPATLGDRSHHHNALVWPGPLQREVRRRMPSSIQRNGSCVTSQSR